MIQNTGKLAGKTVFITGASRGIGKAIGLKIAKDGANVVIAAKTAEPHPKLPGTIYTAAEEIEKAGGKCLPCIVDIREEEQVKTAVDLAVQKFGGIDILVNNASAISLTNTTDTSMKKYDLMHRINTRGTFLTTKYCLPYLKLGQNPHVLNLSPPLNMNPKWFSGHVAYTMAKYGMSMCVLGMAEEFRDDGIAVNALWPKTSIATAAINLIGGKDMMEHSRDVSIMADAAYVMLCKNSKEYTGNFAIDEGVLRAEGVTNFDHYALTKEEPHVDFFLEEHQILAAEGKLPIGGPAVSGDVKSADTANATQQSSNVVRNLFESVNGVLTPKMVSDTQATYNFIVTGDQPGEYFINLKSDSGKAGAGKNADKADVEFTISSVDVVKLFQGQIKATTAYMTGKLKIKGDLGKAVKLEKVLAEGRDKLTSKL